MRRLQKSPFAKSPIVSLNGQPSLLFTEQSTLLEALELKQIKIFSECRSGYCGACKTKILSGSVHYLQHPLAHLEADECLPCCCVPQTDLDLELSLNSDLDLKTVNPTLKTIE